MSCNNCRADEGLHHFETNQCPKNGREECRLDRPQLWEETTFDDSQRCDRVADLTEKLVATVEVLSRIENVMCGGAEDFAMRGKRILQWHLLMASRENGETL